MLGAIFFENIVVFTPILIGMLGAFFAAKRGKYDDARHPEKLLSLSLMRGYLMGCLFCLNSSLCIGLILMFLRATIMPSINGLFLFALIGINMLSPIVGLILYLFCALFGYNLRAHQLAEEKIAQDHGT